MLNCNEIDGCHGRHYLVLRKIVATTGERS